MRVAVIMGGRSSEHDVSMRSGQQVMNVLSDRRPVPVVISKTGQWSVGGVAHPSFGAALDALVASADVAFLALHGAYGEDGTIQGLFETIGFPYTGSGVLGSALAMDKVRAKLVYQSRGLPTAKFLAFTRREWASGRDSLVSRASAELEYPCALKMARGGSSVGVRFPRSAADFSTIADEFFLETDLVLAERFVRGREVTCGVLEKDGRAFALPVTEIVPDTRYEFFDYAAKYTPGATQEITPARIDDGVRERVQELAVAAHLALDCRDFSRTDVMLDERGGPILLETNTIPGLTAQSLLPQAAAVAGMDFRALVELMLENATRRRA